HQSIFPTFTVKVYSSMSFSSDLLSTHSIDYTYRPEFYRLSVPDENVAFEKLLQSGQIRETNNEILSQLRELIKMRFPSRKLQEDDYNRLIDAHLGGTAPDMYGVWVFYPWSGRLVHLLDEDEYVRVRTNRNQYKITLAEQQQLSAKKIGLIGL